MLIVKVGKEKHYINNTMDDFILSMVNFALSVDSTISLSSGYDGITIEFNDNEYFVAELDVYKDTDEFIHKYMEV